MRNPTLKKVMQLLHLAMLGDSQHFSVSTQLEQQAESTTQKKIHRREALSIITKTLAIAPFSGLMAKKALAGWKSHTSPIEPVIILGAGISGLVTAYRLQQARIPCILYETSHRAGGRIFTHRNFNSSRMFCELGAELVDTNHEDLIQLCRELGIDLQSIIAEDEELESSLFYVDGRMISSHEMLTAFQPLAIQIAMDLKDIFGVDGTRVPTYLDCHHPKIVEYDKLSLADYLYSKKDIEKWVLDLINTLYLCEYGLETAEQSSLNFLILISTDTQSELKLLGESDESKRIAGGSSTLSEVLLASIQPHIPIHFNHSLVQIKDTWRGLHLSFRKDHSITSTFASKVVCTIPFSVLREIDGIDLLSLNPRTQACIKTLGYGTNSKLMMNFKQRSWRATSTSHSNGSLLTIEQQQFWETSRTQPGTHGILTHFSGGTLGKEISKSQIHANLEVLNRVFPGIQDQFDQHALLQNWSKVPAAKGSYSCFKPGQYTAFNGFAIEPELSERLYFAGEHTSIENSGFMNGAIQSANATAKKIIAQIGSPILQAQNAV